MSKVFKLGTFNGKPLEWLVVDGWETQNNGYRAYYAYTKDVVGVSTFKELEGFCKQFEKSVFSDEERSNVTEVTYSQYKYGCGVKKFDGLALPDESILGKTIYHRISGNGEIRSLGVEVQPGIHTPYWTANSCYQSMRVCDYTGWNGNLTCNDNKPCGVRMQIKVLDSSKLNIYDDYELDKNKILFLYEKFNCRYGFSDTISKIIKSIPREIQKDNDFLKILFHTNPCAFMQQLSKTFLSKFLADKEVARYGFIGNLRILHEFGEQYLGTEMYNEVISNREYMLECLKKPIYYDDGKYCYHFLDWIGPNLREDKEIIKTLIKNVSGEFKFLDDKFKADYDIAMLAVKCWGSNLKFCSPDLKDNKNIVHEALKEDGNNIQYASDRLQLDPDVNALASKYGAYPELLKIKTKEMIINSLKNKKVSYPDIDPYYDDKDVMLEFARVHLKDPQKGLGPTILNDRKTLFEILRLKPEFYDYLPKELQFDIEICCAAALGGYYEKLVKESKANLDVIGHYFRYQYYIYEYCGHTFFTELSNKFVLEVLLAGIEKLKENNN